jgi:hypothetical protein
MNKKGFLLTEETLKIVIAVIGLVILVYFLIAFFYSGNAAEKQRQAASFIDVISNNISDLSVEGKTIYGLQPKGWWVFGFVGNDEKPNSCSGKNCLCICDKVFDVFDRQIKECAKDGACLVIENLRKFEEIKIQPYREGTTNINIREVGGEIEIR